MKRLALFALAAGGLVAALVAAASAEEPAKPAANLAPPAAVAATGGEAEVNAVVDPTAERIDSEVNRLQFYAGVVGGMHVETLQLREADQSEDRITTVALSRFGLRGRLSGGIYLESEFEVNGGPHGTSARGKTAHDEAGDHEGGGAHQSVTFSRMMSRAAWLRAEP